MVIVNDEKRGTNNNDTLINDKAGYTKLVGLKGNDTYVIKNIANSYTEIDDADSYDETWDPDVPTNSNGIVLGNYGTDTIQIENVKPNDLGIFFDVSLNNYDPEFAPYDDMIIFQKSQAESVLEQFMKVEQAWGEVEEEYYDKEYNEEEIEQIVMSQAAPQNGGVYIPNQFGDTNNGGTQLNVSAIENIQVVDTTSNTVKTLNTQEYITNVREQVVELLTEANNKGIKDNYGSEIMSAVQLLSSGNTEYINKLVNIYKNQNFEPVGSEGNESPSIPEPPVAPSIPENVLVIKAGQEHTIITPKKGGQDTIRIEGFLGLSQFEYRKDGNNLVIYYNDDPFGDNNSYEKLVTIKNYLKNPHTSPIQYIEYINTNGNKYSYPLVEDISIDIYGQDGKKNNLVGTIFYDRINGGNLDDTIKGGDSRDVIRGNKGNDKIYGGAGHNEYQIYDGDGNDVVYYDKNGQDTLIFMDTNLNNLHLEKGKYNGIKIVTNKGDSVELANYLKTGLTSVKEIGAADSAELYSLEEFLDGKALIINGDDRKNSLKGTAIEDEIYGHEGNDTIKAAAGDDILVGGAGDDKLYGGAGKNEYRISTGGGNDVVYYDKNASNDVLNFTDAKMNELYIEKGKYNGIKIVNKSGDSFELANYLKNGKTSVAEIHTGKDGQTQSLAEFLDGKMLVQYGDFKKNSLKGTSANDEIYGYEGNDTIKAAAGDDILVGGAGDDKLYGGAGDNEYRISTGDGNDVVYYDKTASNDVLVFETSKLDQLHIEKGKYNGIKIVNQNGDSFELANYLKNGKTSVAEIYTGKDGQTQSLAEFLDGKMLVQHGNERKNSLKGTSIDDEIYGYEGNDTIKAGAGDDILVGGRGDDKLYGENGTNIFHFSNNDGKDTIYMGKGVDKIVLDPSVITEPTFTRNKNNLVIEYGSVVNGEKSSITVSNYFKSKYQSLQTIEYGNREYNIKDIVIDGYINDDGVKELCGNSNDNLIYCDKKLNMAFGGAGDDTYQVDSLKRNVAIFDNQGSNKLIVNEKASNINVLFEVNSDGSAPIYDLSSVLVMNDANMKKLAKNYDLSKVSSGIEIADGVTSIEEIYSKDNKVLNIGELKNTVASWLSSNGYDSALEVLSQEKTEGDIEALLAIYQNANWM